jgi:hypothetical protein
MIVVNAPHSNHDSIMRTGLMAVFAGLMMGVFYVCYERSWSNLLSGIAAGIGFTVVFFIMTVLLRLSKEGWRLYALAAVAGLAGGLAWWSVAEPHSSPFVAVIIGGIGAPVAMWAETRNKDTKTANKAVNP